MHRLRSHWGAARKQRGPTDALIAFHREAHNLAGSSASFGYANLHLLAMEIERRAKTLQEDAADATTLASEIEERIHRLPEAITRDEGTPGP